MPCDKVSTSFQKANSKHIDEARVKRWQPLQRMSIVSMLAHRTSVFAQYAAHGEERELK
jgi:hypothetical protein